MTDHSSVRPKYHTMKHLVYNELRSQIMDGTYPPGYHLVTENLAKQLGVSPTPVREALHRLEADGLVQMAPHHGAEVSQLSTADIIEIYHIRGALERLVTRLAQPNLTPENIRYLSELVDEMETAAQNMDMDRILIVNREFHLVIWEAARSPRLLELMEIFYATSQRYRNVSLTVPGRLEQISLEHRRILEGLQSGDTDLACRYAEEHYEGTAQYLLESLEAEKNKSS